MKIRGSVQPLIVDRSVEGSRVFFTLKVNERGKLLWLFLLLLLFFIFPVHSARWKTYSKNLLYEYWGFIDGFHLVEWMFGETWKHSFRSIRRCIAIDLPIMETARRPVYSIINYLTRRLITNTYRPRNWIVPQSLALYCNAFAFRNSTSGIEVKIENFR